jgi:hypothetical protein
MKSTNADLLDPTPEQPCVPCMPNVLDGGTPHISHNIPQDTSAFSARRPVYEFSSCSPHSLIQEHISEMQCVAEAPCPFPSSINIYPS